MEDEELDLLGDLMGVIDEDGDFNETELASLDTDEKQANKTSSGNNTTQENDDSNKEKDITRKVSEMEKYIKFLESQLKTQKKSNSPESKDNDQRSKCEFTALQNPSSEKRKSSHFEKPSVEKTKQESTSSSHEISSKTSNSSKRPTKTTESVSISSITPQRSIDTGTKQRIAHTPCTSNLSDTPSSQKENKTGGKKRKAEGPVPQASAPKRSAQEQDGVTDGFSGIKILNPLVSSSAMERRMKGRKMIKISSIQSNLQNNDIEGDWVTIGVLVQKLPPKTSVKGNQYSIWKLSDLAFHLPHSIVSFFLFGETHKEHWKTSEGSVVAFLNPSIMPSKEKQSKDVALTIDNPKKLMLMGMSQDFGRCQGARKSDGSKCSNFVNKSLGNFCEYHVRREYNKTRSKRMECQQGYGAPTGRKSKLKQKVASESFFYEGRTVSSYIPPPQKEKVTLNSFSAKTNIDRLGAWEEKQNGSTKSGCSSSENDGPSNDFLNLLKIPTVGSRNLMRQLHQEEEKVEKETNQYVSAKEFLKANKVGARTSGSSTTPLNTPISSNDKQNPRSRTPVLGRGLNSNDDLIFDENVSLNTTLKKSTTDMDKAKRKALAFVRQTGPLSPQDPNNSRPKKLSPKVQKTINDKLEANTLDSTVPDVVKTSSFTLATGFDLKSSEGQKILKAKSKHVGEVKEAELKEQQKYFESREKKEAMEDKMKTITQLKVKAFHCLQCKYIAEKPSGQCSTEQHTVKKLNVFKKIFECKDCKERTVSYGQRYPTHHCRKCGGKNFEKCSMWKEKNGPKIGRETLLLRGPEYAKFLNSTKTVETNGILPKFL